VNFVVKFFTTENTEQAQRTLRMINELKADMEYWQQTKLLILHLINLTLLQKAFKLNLRDEEI